MFGSTGLPHSSDFLAFRGLLWLNVISDSLIALAFFLIPLTLIRIVRKRNDIPFNGMVFCFAAFIAACGATHIMAVVLLWHPIYWVSGGLKAITAVMSLLTLAAMTRSSPSLLAMPHELADRRFRELIDDAPDAIVQVNERGTIAIANKTAVRMFGYTHEELLGSSVDLLIPHANRAAHPHHRDLFLKSGVTRSMGKGMGDLHARRKDGTEFCVEIGLSPVKTATGLHVTAMIRDVTDRKRMERELEEVRAYRNHRIEILARLSSGLAHEIKNPLAIIHARASDLAELAEEGDVDRAQITKACDSIVRTSDRAIRILRGIAAMARVGTHDPMQFTSVQGLIEQAMDLVQGRYMTRDIQLNAVLAPGLPMLECREVQISQILVNLLNNAFDAVDGDSKSERWVRVEASMQHHADDEDAVDQLQIDVLDGGPGVPPENMEFLMQEFFTTKAAGVGTGLGLSVSRAIAEEHGGGLELRLCDGHTCFRLVLPVKATGVEGVARHES
jgi:PAS domain S-box-containing protein